MSEISSESTDKFFDQLKAQEPIGWYTEDHLIDKSATTYDKSVADRWRAKGWPVYALYAAPRPAHGVVKALKTAANRMERLALEVDGDWRGYATEWAEEALATYRAAMGSNGE